MEWVKVSWDDEIPNMMGKIKNVPNHQLVYSIALLIGVKVWYYIYTYEKKNI